MHYQKKAIIVNKIAISRLVTQFCRGRNVCRFAKGYCKTKTEYIEVLVLIEQVNM